MTTRGPRELIVGTMATHAIVRLLGHGGQADTYLCERPGLPGTVPYLYCVKLHHRASDEEAFQREFTREIYVHQQLKHGLIVRAFEADYDQTRKRGFLVMEFVDGCDLKTLLKYYADKGSRMPLQQSLHIFSETAHALHVAHELTIDGIPQNLVHRDVTPDNLLLGKDGFVKLCDFGITLVANKRSHTAAGTAKGKAAYMAPEQYNKEGRDRRTDLFSLGVMLYEMLAGVGPFEAEDDKATFKAVWEGKYEPLQTYAPMLDPALLELVEELLQPDKEKRPESALLAAERAHAIMAALPGAGGSSQRRELGLVVQLCVDASRPSQTSYEGEEEAHHLLNVRSVRAVDALRSLNAARATPASELTSQAVTDEREGHEPGEPDTTTVSVLQVTGTTRLPVWRRKPMLVTMAASASALAIAITFGIASQGSPTVIPSPETGTARRAQVPDASHLPLALAPTTPPVSAPVYLETPSPESPGEPSPEPSPGSASARPEAAARSGEKRQTGIITVLVHVNGYVKIDGQNLGLAPVTRAVSPGSHLVEVSELEGETKGKYQRATLVVKAGKTTTRMFRLQDTTFKRSP